MDMIDTTKFSRDAKTKKECIDEITRIRWADGFICPKCGEQKAYPIKSRNVLECANKACKKQVTATAGTQFHGSKKIEQIYSSITQIDTGKQSQKKRGSQEKRKEAEQTKKSPLKECKPIIPETIELPKIAYEPEPQKCRAKRRRHKRHR